LKILKRNGELEDLDIGKISTSLQWAAKDIEGVSTSDVEVAANLHFYDGIPSTEIQDIMIKTVKDLISLKNPNYDAMGVKLLILKLNKEAYQQNNPPNLKLIFSLNTGRGVYSRKLFKSYSDKEYHKLHQAMDFSRNYNFSMAGLEQLIDKYLLKNEGTIIEDPQTAFMAIAMDMFMNEKKSRIRKVIDMYEALSNFKISLPTPMMKALRTTDTSYASCIAYSIGDTIDSWVAGKTALVEHTVASAGIGVDISAVASINDTVKNGKIKHPGKIPLMKAIDADIQMSSQNGRRGSALTYTNFFDPEVERILSLKSPRTEVTKRINDLHHAIKMNQLVYIRAKKKEDITLFSVRKHPELDELFNSNKYEEFVALYESLEQQNPEAVRIPARDFWDRFSSERDETGVYFLINIDEVNNSTAYRQPSRQSNICLEYIPPFNGHISNKKKTAPTVGVCILSNINQGTVSIEELPKYTELIVRGLNNIIHRQTQPTGQATAFVKGYASLGIGFANHAYFIAKLGSRFGSPEALKAHDRWMENFQYYLLKASMLMAKEDKQPAPLFNETTYSLGIMPVDRYKKTVDELVHQDPECNWEELRADIEKYGMKNATLSMVPPSESSSVVSNSTSGMEPIRALLTNKGSKTNTMKQLAPEAIKLADKYDCAFDRKITKDYLKHVIVTQKWIDMSISANTFYNPELYKDQKVSQKEIIEDMFFFKYYGGKTLYYHNTKTEDDVQQETCEGGSCSV
jgi:ribonucleoside-diphosphate reductase alpha chain